ncbi:MAG: S-layer homology domain-containing protein [Candidatus Heteroscillospira sp.]|jgi:hypothetical protein
MRYIRRILVLCAVILLLTLSAQAYSPKLSEGQENIVKRARQLSEIEWTPLQDVYQWNYSGVFKAGTTYVGLPYGQPVHTKGYVGWDISLETFLEAVSNRSSRFYSSYSWYNKISPYYAIDCSGYLSYAWQTKWRLTTGAIPEYADRVSSQSINAIQVGDALNLAYNHVVLISAVDLDSSGRVAGLKVMEATPGITQTTGYGTLGPQSLKTFQSRYFDRGYVLYRNPNRDKVQYTHSCAVPIDGDTCSNCRDALPFYDVSKNAWYRSAVSHVYERGLFYGTSGSSFSPNARMTRGMFITALSRLAGVPESESGEYYTNAVKWARSMGIVEDGDFRAGDSITREDMAVMLHRYAGLPKSSGRFNDHSDISPYAREAVYALKSAGILSGLPDGRFAPKATATRAEVAQLFRNFSEAG